MPNDPHHWRRGGDVRLGTETQYRRPVNVPGSASFEFQATNLIERHDPPTAIAEVNDDEVLVNIHP